jgi:hypothetical protein
MMRSESKYYSPSAWNFQKNVYDEGNTGFYFVRGNAKTVNLFSKVVESMSRYFPIVMNPFCRKELKFLFYLTEWNIWMIKRSFGSICGTLSS